MSSLGKIFLYALLAVLGGALVAPQAWHAIQLLPSDWLHGEIGAVQRMPFHRYLTRSIQVAAILFLWPLLRSLHVRSMKEFGLYPNRHKLRDAAAGLGAGIPSALLLVTAFLISGAFEFHSAWSPSVMPGMLLTALVVAVLEEFLFRGVILGFFRQSLGNGIAIFFSAVIFTGFHFLNLPSSGMAGGAPRWWSGFALLLGAGGGIPSWPLWGWASGTLLLAGVILGWMTTRTGSLWASTALHGCWILGQQCFNSMTSYRHLPPAAFLPFTGPAQCHGAVPVGLDALFSLLLAGALAVILLRKRPRPSPYAFSSSVHAW